MKAFSTGGTTLSRRVPSAYKTAYFKAEAVAVGNIDHNNAKVPVTNGAAALVPPKEAAWPSEPKLVMFSAGALMPQRPVERPKFDALIGRQR
jgi:hypothetical protein